MTTHAKEGNRREAELQYFSMDTVQVRIVSDQTADQSSNQKHNVEDDVWIIVSGGVYNVSKFLKMHPGIISEFYSSNFKKSFLMR